MATSILSPLAVTVTVLLLHAAAPAAGHSVGYQKCVYIKGMDNFDITKFYGKWYVNEVYQSINSCINLNYEEKVGSTDEVKISQRRQLAGVNNVRTNYAGTAKVKGAVQSEMTIKWPVSGLFGEMSHIILDTDYTTYAVTYECQTILSFGRRFSASILSREPQLDASVVAAAKKTASDRGVTNLEDFKKVSQVTCTKEGEGIEIDTDPDSYKGINLLGLVSDEKVETIKTEDELIRELSTE